jgi:hypothetical protein
MSELTYQDVAEHNTKKDIYMVIHDKIYDASKFIDEHPYVNAPPALVTNLPGIHAVTRALVAALSSSPITDTYFVAPN